MSFILSIDPGLSGCVAVFDPSLSILHALHDLPTRKQGKGASAGAQVVDFLPLVDTLRPYAVPGAMAYIEVAITKPPMALASAKTIGRGYEAILCALAILQIGVREIAPHDWKARLGLSDDKKDSIAMASQLYPAYRLQFSAQKSADRAEAALIARACLNKDGSIA